VGIIAGPNLVLYCLTAILHPIFSGHAILLLLVEML
jgi:hypothetical protein